MDEIHPPHKPYIAPPNQRQWQSELILRSIISPRDITPGYWIRIPREAFLAGGYGEPEFISITNLSVQKRYIETFEHWYWINLLR